LAPDDREAEMMAWRRAALATGVALALGAPLALRAAPAVFDPSVRLKTDQFILKFKKPG
jgi:predicted methyltransferase